ncbi:hypothetical protein BP5796_13041 [Coleophoma crateriformis]|uniref:Adenosine deaminase domain-containing protein n=1 Tax=Coleophoma crateriformis TaxID=565419 RepID=A0A3D8Q6D5_9HELO|nr:hypothetical protein BP5796_13041 [Coleophoma crateriformis]
MASKTSLIQLQEWSDRCQPGKDRFIQGLPKLELHIHIEGTLSPELRWRLAQRNNILLYDKRMKHEYQSLQQLQDAYLPKFVDARGEEPRSTADLLYFFELFDEGLLVLKKEEDFYELAMEYFARCAEENVRYAEVFFGPHSHRHRGIEAASFMNGYRRAQQDAEKKLGIVCQWIMLINRQKPLEEAWENYRTVAIPYKDMVAGIGLAGNEIGKPPMLFEEVLAQAREDGFKITAHCDVDVPDTHNHIRQVLTTLSGTGADRCDHGLNIAQSEDLIRKTKEKNMGLTICPWGYVIYTPDHPIWLSLRRLHEAEVQITINSDDPPYMMGHYTEGNLSLLKVAGHFENSDIAKFVQNSINICWASDALKNKMMYELMDYTEKNLK